MSGTTRRRRRNSSGGSAGGFAPPDIFGPYGWEDNVNPGTGLTFLDTGTELVITASDAFQGTYAARMHYVIAAGAVGNQDSNRRVMVDVTSYNLDHIFVRAYVKFDGATLDYAGDGANVIQRKLIYLKSDPSNTTWFVIIHGFNLDLAPGAYGDAGSTPVISLTNFAALSPQYSLPIDVYRGLEVEVQVNTPGNSDGYMTIWVYNPDGTTLLTQTFSGLKIRGDGDLAHLRNVEIGNQANRTVTGIGVDEYRWWDTIAISTQRIGPAIGAGASGFTAWDVGIDFRATAIYVTDPANCVPCLNDTYPVGNQAALGMSVRKGITAGAGTPENGSTGVDPRLAGAWYRSHALGAGQVSHRIDLKAPMPGIYDLRLALGSIIGTNFPFVELKDGPGGGDGTGNVLFTISDVAGCAIGQFYDAAGVIRTSAADWVTNNASRSIVLTGSQLIINFKYLSPLGSGRNAIAHLRLTRTG